MPSPVVSVIIPTHNRAQLVCRAIRSVLSQTFQDHEIVVVDDASTDDTEKIVCGLGDPRIRFVRRDKNGGVAAARNSGIVVAQGQYVSFLDSDDEYLPTKLEKQIHLLNDAGSRVGGVECGLKIVAGSQEYVRPPNLKGLGHKDLFSFERGVNVAPLLVRRELAAMLGFDESAVLEDWDFIFRLLRISQLVFVDETLVIIHNPTGARLSTATNLMRGLQQLIHKYGSELKDRPKVLARWHHRLAFFYVRRGDVQGARAQFLEAVRLQPWSVVGRVLYTATLLGGSSFNRIHKLYVYVGRIKRRLRVALGSAGLL